MKDHSENASPELGQCPRGSNAGQDIMDKEGSRLCSAEAGSSLVASAHQTYQWVRDQGSSTEARGSPVAQSPPEQQPDPGSSQAQETQGQDLSITAGCDPQANIESHRAQRNRRLPAHLDSYVCYSVRYKNPVSADSSPSVSILCTRYPLHNYVTCTRFPATHRNF